MVASPFKQIDFIEPDGSKLIPQLMKQWLNVNNKKNILYPPKDEAFASKDAGAFIGFSKKLMTRF